MGLLKQSLVENNIFGLTDTGLIRLRSSIYSDLVGDPPFFVSLLAKVDHYLSVWQV